MSKELATLLPQKIFVPHSVRDWELVALPFSVRLRNVLQKLNCLKLGDLHRQSYENIFLLKNCGGKTLLELRDFIVKLHSADSDQLLSVLLEVGKKEKRNELRPAMFYIPQDFRGLQISSFPLSTRLANVLRDLGIRLVGDLHGFHSVKLMTLNNCGRKTVLELNEFIDKIQKGKHGTKSPYPEFVLIPQELSLIQFIEYVDRFFNELPSRKQKILSLRFGGESEEPLTLEEIGGKYGITRERVRQIESGILKRLDTLLGEAGKFLFDKLYRDCLTSICPLTPQLLAFWTQKEPCDFVRSPSFYIRILEEFAPNIPTLTKGPNKPKQLKNKRTTKICLEVRNLLSSKATTMSSKEIFEKLKTTINNLTENEILDALLFSNFVSLHFDSPNKPAAKFTGKRNASEFAHDILTESDSPLTPEEIIKRANEKYGRNVIGFSPHSLANLPFYSKGFYLLDSRAIGLLKHFKLPECRWDELRNDFFDLLKENNRSFSTTEVVAEKLFDWTDHTNAIEAAQILREDLRFKDLRRFHFALAEWEIEERGTLRNLFIEILEHAGHPLTSTEILEQAQKYRSVAATSLPTVLSQTEEIKTFGCGFYGLKIWEEKSRDFLLKNRLYINRFVSRWEPPLTFGDLCQKLGIAEIRNLTDQLWQTLRALPKIKIKSKEKTPETILVHMNWRLERAIQKVLAQDESPLSSHEIQWELNKLFGTTFSDRKLNTIINCLQNNEMFVRNPQGEYMLDEQLDLAVFDTEWLRYACIEILTEENAMLSADDLLEKLEAEELANENISGDMLATILRGDISFNEIGTNMFMAAK